MFEEQDDIREIDRLHFISLFQELGIEVLKIEDWLFYLKCYNLVIEVGENGHRLYSKCINDQLTRVYFPEEIQGSEGCSCFIDGSTHVTSGSKKPLHIDTPIEKITSVILNAFKR